MQLGFELRLGLEWVVGAGLDLREIIPGGGNSRRLWFGSQTKEKIESGPESI